MFFRLLWESFRRQRRRKLLAGVAILLGTTAVTAMLALATTIGDRIHRELAVYGANIVITPAAAGLDVNVGGVAIRPATGNAYLKESDLEKLRGIFWANNITGVSPELDLSGMMLKVAPMNATGYGPSAIWHVGDPRIDGNGSIPVSGVGYWFAHPFGSLKTGAPQLHPWWRITGRWPVDHEIRPTHSEEAEEIVVGSGLAKRFGLKVGDWISVGTEFEGDIVGIVTAGDATDEQVLFPLDGAVMVTPIDSQGRGGVPEFQGISRVEVSARTRPEDAFARKDPAALSPAQREIWYCRPYANSIAFQIREAIPGADAEQVRRVEQSEGNVLKRISGLMWLVSLAALVAAGFAVSAAMATAILERRGEIGLLRSLGASRGAVAALFYVEAAILAVVAGSIGFLVGSGLAFWLGHRIFPGEAAGAVLNPVLLPVVVGLALLVAMAGSTPAIRQALRMDPSAVLRAGA